MGSRVWGIDIGSTGIKVVELSPGLRGDRVTNYGFFPLQGGEKLQKLREIFPKLEGGVDGLIVPLASHRTMVHRMPLPFQDRKKNLRVVKYEAEPFIPYPIDQVVVDFCSPEKDKQGRASLVFALRKEDLREELLLLQEAGLDPESVIPEAMALFWVAKKMGKASEGTGALLDLGHEKTTLIVWNEGDLTLVRSIPIAGAAVTRAMEKSLHIPPQEASSLKAKGGGSPEGQKAIADTLGHLAEEVQRTLVSYEYGPDGRPVEDIFLTGGSALLPGVEKVLGERLKKPVTILNLEENLPSLFRDVPKQLHHVLTVAMGATLWSSSPERINFRQEEFASSEKAKKVKTRLKLLVSYAVILAILGIAAFSLNLYLQEKKYRELKTEIRKEFLQAQPGVKKVVSEIQQMKALVREEKARVDALGGTPAAISPLEIIRELSLMLEPAWKVRITELIVSPETVEVNGEANSFDTVNQLKAKLDRSSLYREVQLKTARASSLENVIEFKLQMKRGT